MALLGLTTCGRLVLGQGAKVLSHILEDVDRKEEEQGDQRDGDEEREVDGVAINRRETHTDR